jgi:phosphoserine phosphatase RsbU/P
MLSHPADHKTERLPECTRDLLISAKAVTPADLNQQVFDRFEAEPSLMSLPVTEEGLPIGMINRGIFMQSLARPFYREIYLKKSCIAFMDKQPLVVEANTDIQTLSFRVLEGGSKVLLDGFIITEQGRYAGIGRAQDMLRAIALLQAEKNRQVMESIDYGSVIQCSISRASRLAMEAHLSAHFLIWEPRDVVSGDLYYFHPTSEGFLLVVFDCTGHGVPGAFMTLIMTSFLQNAIDSESCKDPGELIARVSRQVKLAMGQEDRPEEAMPEGNEHRSDDGMDAAFIWFEHETRTLTYAGAHMPLFVLEPGAPEVRKVEGAPFGVGYASTPMDQVWENHQMVLPPQTRVFAFSDGYIDQLGGPKRIAHGKKRLRTRLFEWQDLPLPAVKEALLANLREWQGSEPRKDDVCAVGFEV